MRLGRFFLGSAVVLLLAPALVPRAAGAASPAPPIPASLYPAGAHIHYEPNVTSERMDALWDFDGNREPLMHDYPQSQFQRQGGWMQRATLRRGNRIMWFVLFDSTYGSLLDGRQGNTFAYDDLQMMLTDWWHADLTASQPTSILPAGSTGAAETRLIPRSMDGPALTLSAWWGTSQEIEAIAYYTPHFLNPATIRHLLAAQVRYAIEHVSSQLRRGTGHVRRQTG